MCHSLGHYNYPALLTYQAIQPVGSSPSRTAAESRPRHQNDFQRSSQKSARLTAKRTFCFFSFRLNSRVFIDTPFIWGQLRGQLSNLCYPSDGVAPMPLTDTAIRAIKPTTKAAKLFDGGGLYLEAAPQRGQVVASQVSLSRQGKTHIPWHLPYCRPERCARTSRTGKKTS